MTWLEYHKASEHLAADAEMAARRGERARSRQLYSKAADEELRALNEIDSSKRRTTGVSVVSAVSLCLKANRLAEGEAIACTWLASENLAPFAADDLRGLLKSIWRERDRERGLSGIQRQSDVPSLDAVRRLWERLRMSRSDPTVLKDSGLAIGDLVLPLLADLDAANRTIDDLTRSIRALAAVLDLFPVAAIVLDGEGNFLTSNEAARALYGGDSVPSSLPVVAAQAVREGADPRVSIVSHPTERGRALRVVPVEFGVEPGLSVVILVPRLAVPLIEPNALAACLGLTNAQASVVSLVAEGMTDREISERLGISIQIVRKRLTASYKRTGVGGRAGVGALAYVACFGRAAEPHALASIVSQA